MAEDAVFLTPGQPPFGKDAFEAGCKTVIQNFRIEPKGEIREIHVTGDWAYCWTHLVVTMTPLQGGSPMRRNGYTLTIFRKKPDGLWGLARDANLLTAERLS